MLNHTNSGDTGPNDDRSTEVQRQMQSVYRQAVDNLLVEMSESEEMYLITVAQLVEQGVQQPIAISRLAKELTIQPVSANQMVHKLAEEGMVEYLPYKGVRLTPKGGRVARQVLRHRRLWQVFLEEHLHMAADEADALACRLEHITPAGVVNRLADFLGNPAVTPQGLPIPEAAEEARLVHTFSLADIPVGQACEVVQVKADAATRAFLASSGLRPGQVITVVAAGGDGNILLQAGEERLHLTVGVSNSILVK